MRFWLLPGQRPLLAEAQSSLRCRRGQDFSQVDREGTALGESRQERAKARERAMNHKKTEKFLQSSKRPRVIEEGKNILDLEKAGPIQMGFWVPNRVWATAKFLVPLRHAIAAKKKEGKLAPMRPE